MFPAFLQPFLLFLFYYMGSGCLDPSIVRHVCFDLFQHTTKINGELAYAFDLLVGIDNHREQYYKQVDKDDPLRAKRSKEDDHLKTNGKSIPIRHEINLLMSFDNNWERQLEPIDKHNFPTGNRKLISFKTYLHVEIDKEGRHHFNTHNNGLLIEDDTPLKHTHLKNNPLKSNLLTTDKEPIPNEINPLIAIDKYGECHWEAGNDTALQNEEIHWETEMTPSYQMGSIIGNLRLLSQNILICL